jgi:hypothetical protein
MDGPPGPDQATVEAVAPYKRAQQCIKTTKLIIKFLKRAHIITTQHYK